MSDIVTHPNDDTLRENLLTDEALFEAEHQYPGAIRILASGRYHARVQVFDEVWNLRLMHTSIDEPMMMSDKGASASNLLRDLVWHRAAEAMLAHRRGHMEAHLHKKLRKPKTEQDD